MHSHFFICYLLFLRLRIFKEDGNMRTSDSYITAYFLVNQLDNQSTIFFMPGLAGDKLLTNHKQISSLLSSDLSYLKKCALIYLPNVRILPSSLRFILIKLLASEYLLFVLSTKRPAVQSFLRNVLCYQLVRDFRNFVNWEGGVR